MADDDSIAPEFAEQLPLNCPPETAVNLGERNLLRLWTSATPSFEAFLSYTAMGYQVTGTAPACSYASCSMYVIPNEDTEDQLRAMRSLPKFRRFSHAFIVAVNDNAGIGDFGKRGHVDTWLYASFDPVAAVVDVRQF